MTSGSLRSSLRLYLVVDPDQGSGELVTTAVSAIAGGVTMVQLRSKDRTDRETIAIGRSLQAICANAGIPFIVNDRLDLALALSADGVHLGVDDLALEDARRLAGPDFIIGFSPDSDEQARMAERMGADYLGLGPLFATATKADAGEALGIEEFARRRALSSLPVIAIGGINGENASGAIEAGANGVAVVSAIMRAADPESAARDLANAVRA